MYTSEQRPPRAFTAESPQAAAHNNQENEERPPRGPKNNEVDRDVQQKKMPTPPQDNGQTKRVFGWEGHASPAAMSVLQCRHDLSRT